MTGVADRPEERAPAPVPRARLAAVLLALFAALCAWHLVPHRGRDFELSLGVHLAATAAWGVLAAWVVAGRLRPRFPVALALCVAARALLVPLGPELSDDVHRYVWEGTLVLHGVDPFLHAPTDPALAALRGPTWALINVPDIPAIYPPAMQLAMAGGVLLRADHVGQSIVFGGCDLLTFVALWRWLPALGLPRERALLHGLCPLALLEFAGEAHGDALAACGMVCALWASTARRGSAAGALLAVATAGKYLPAVLLPFVVRRHGWRSLVAFALVTAALWAPFVPLDRPLRVLEPLRLYAAHWRSNESAFAVLEWLAGHALRTVGAYAVDPTRATKLLIALLGAALLAWAWRRRWSPERIAIAFSLFYVGCATTVHPWYVAGLVVPWLPLWPSPWLCAATGTAFAGYHVVPRWLLERVWSLRWPWRVFTWAPFWGGLGVAAWRRLRAGRDSSGLPWVGSSRSARHDAAP
ncbi:MAG: DUF2029 domain-containing protein [Planctomycetes bacterium]|nr:DUF2029 domain-containing protein [Planctomycetota bacterium]